MRSKLIHAKSKMNEVMELESLEKKEKDDKHLTLQHISPNLLSVEKPLGYKVARQAIENIKGPLLFLKALKNPIYGGILLIELPDGTLRKAQNIETSDKITIAQVFEGTYNLNREDTKIVQKGEIFKIKFSEAMLGIPLSGLGEPLDPDIKIYPEVYLDITNNPINPSARDVPESPIETGIPAIDGLNTLVKGQKLPIFTGPGLPANKLATRIAKHVAMKTGENFTVVFAAMGITHREGDYFKNQFEKATNSSNIAFFLNFIEDPTVERILTPRCALQFAEYLAFEKNKDVLIILTDMLSYADALREIATAREEIPGRRGYPGYLYTDLATIYERSGRIIGKKGSITQIPIVTMPNNDITHPVPDLTGYITEGQIVLTQNLHYKGVDPPIDVLPSLSRLMNSGIGKDRTRLDHKYVANQLFSCYAEGRKLRQISAITGEESLSHKEQLYMTFADVFENYFINSRPKSIIETLSLGWKLLGIIPKEEHIKIPEQILDQYYRPMVLIDFEEIRHDEAEKVWEII